MNRKTCHKHKDTLHQRMSHNRPAAPQQHLEDHQAEEQREVLAQKEGQSSE